jgi:hypothetical protein
MKRWKISLAIAAALSASIALADDFKTINGKEYKNVTVTRVDPDGINVKNTKAGVIAKLYFTELPKEVQERFHYGSATPIGKAVTQRVDNAESAQHATPDFAQQLEITLDEHVNRFSERVQKQLEERESILKGKHTPGPAELSAMREIHFHEAFLAGTAIIAIVLFAIVWRRFK